MIIIYFLISSLIVAILIGFLIFVIKMRKKELRETVFNNSPRIYELMALYNETNFNRISKQIYINKFYDNKSNYNRIEPAYVMSAELRNNIDYYSDLIKKIQENKEKELQYFERFNAILNKEYFIDYNALNVTEEKFKEEEREIINTMDFSSYTDCTVCVYMSYSSPKGQVHLSKNEIFTFNQMLISFNSISRSYLDKETYKNISKVERGEVSDSLRYDVMNRDNFRCIICGASAHEGARLHVDHIIPVAKGGKSTIDNLRTLCERCNVGKSDKIETGFSQSPSSENHRCPWCNGELVLRNGRYGEFYGCKNFPKCRFVQNISK